jgi:hypothetical protein
VLSDTRLTAFAVDQNAFVFQGPQGTAEVEVTLWYRRAYRELMQQKGWADEDILMEQEAIRLD